MKILIALFTLIQFQTYGFKCTKEYRPVCGDNKTYSNRCMAQASGASEIKDGACESDSSKKEMFKQKVQRTSPPKPSEMCVCPMIWKPVCGIDGKTYGSSCNARCKNVPIKHQGECKKIESH